MDKTRLKIAPADADTPVRFTISLGRLLALSFGGLVAIAVGIVLVLTVMTNFVNTFSLLNARAIELFDDMEGHIRSEAEDARRAVSIVARLYAQHQIGLNETPEQRGVLETLLQAIPSVEAVFVFDGTQTTNVLFRRPEAAIGPPPKAFRDVDLAQLFSLDKAKGANGPLWLDPVVVNKTMYLPVMQRLDRDDGKEGVVVALIGRESLSRMMVQLGKDNDATVFLLGPNKAVIAHSGLPEVFEDRVFIPLDEFPDETLREIGNVKEETRGFEKAAEHGIHVLVSRGGGGSGGHLYMTKQLTGYASNPFTLGIYFRKADIAAEMLRTRNSLIAGGIGLLAAVLAAIALGRYMSRPMAQIARTAAQFSSFEIDEIQPVPRSRVREVDDQAVALNRMHTTLQQFTRYVPRELVARLMRSGGDAARPVEREMTIMFTDIVGFTSLSERMSAAEITALLNRHFAMITRHVEETGGAIDKFLGDGVMAFWGAPEADSRHVVHAVAAAQAIARSVHKENAARRERGEAVLRLRVGIHTGRVVVGNIGGDDRQNYTIVGDAVNVAQRIEQMARDVMNAGDEAVVLVSVDVAAAVDDEAHFVPLGTRIVRGRKRPIGVSVLQIDDERAGGNVVPFAGSGTGSGVA